MAILSGSLAFSLTLHDLTADKAVLTVWLCDCRCLLVEGVILFAVPRRFCPITATASRAFFWSARTTIGRCVIVA
ncbi:MAG: hypothetical protein GDA36_01750 [Rhodobacteraceae bacterium]|nr:hypothetical protein [Paracoccaceae bacterium]